LRKASPFKVRRISYNGGKYKMKKKKEDKFEENACEFKNEEECEEELEEDELSMEKEDKEHFDEGENE
jgi:hypothetical protein